MFLWRLVLGEWYYFFEKNMSAQTLIPPNDSLQASPSFSSTDDHIFHLLINCIVYNKN